MIDIEIFRTNPEIVRQDLKKRRELEKLRWVDEIIEKDKEWRAGLLRLQDLQHTRNTLSLQINEFKKAGKDIAPVIAQVKAIPQQIDQQQRRCNELSQSVEERIRKLPNITHESVPYGKDTTENVTVRTWGKPRSYNFPLKNHAEVAEAIGVADFDRSAKISGKGFYFISGGLAQLNQALLRFAIDALIKKGYRLLEPPFMIRREPYSGVTDLADFENVMYKIEDEDAYLIATSEHPICAYFMNETIDEDLLPLKFAGISPCFRKEVGAHGIDEKGLFRTHQFWKVEQFIFCRPEDSWKLHDEMIKAAESLFQHLDIPHRVVNICTGDLGTVAAKKYDIDAWMPRSKEYKEVVSGSNCTEWQSRRLNIRYGKEGGQKRYVHTINCTAIATSRAMVAILENYQNADGSVTIPKVLRPYMNGMKVISSSSEQAFEKKRDKKNKRDRTTGQTIKINNSKNGKDNKNDKESERAPIKQKIKLRPDKKKSGSPSKTKQK